MNSMEQKQSDLARGASKEIVERIFQHYGLTPEKADYDCAQSCVQQAITLATSEKDARIEAALQAQASKWQTERTELCVKLLVALSEITCTPEETYGSNIDWAVTDACNAIKGMIDQLTQLQSRLYQAEAKCEKQRSVGDKLLTLLAISAKDWTQQHRVLVDEWDSIKTATTTGSSFVKVEKFNEAMRGLKLMLEKTYGIHAASDSVLGKARAEAKTILSTLSPQKD